jgi:hypothetical protein
MGRLSKSQKILIPDVPPPRATRQALVITGIGVLCATGLVAAIVLLLTGL